MQSRARHGVRVARSVDEEQERLEALNREAWEIGLVAPTRSRELAERALELARELDDRRGEGLASRTLGYNALQTSDVESALSYSSAAVDILRTLDDGGALATALNTLGILYARLGDFEKSLACAVECLALNREVGDRRGEAWASTEIGNVHLQTGELARAREHFDQALTIFEEIDYAPGAGRVLALLGRIAARSGDPARARDCHERSLELADRDGLAISILANSVTLAELHLEAGDREQARAYLERALKASKDVVLVELQTDVHVAVARMEIADERYDEAHAELQTALALVSGHSHIPSEAELHEVLSNLYERQGQHERALHHFKEFHRLKSEIFDEEGRARLRNLQIRLEVEQAEKQAEIERLRYVELAGVQAELVQSEKMALLGRLVAGLSHEINTPIGVIRSNASLVGRAVQILQEERDAPSSSARVDKALATLTSAQRTSAEAAARLQELVRSLKGYARLDEAELQRVDITVCVSDTLSLFETQLPGHIVLRRQLTPLPEATCRPGQLNQVFMTLLVNAREAIDDAGEIAVRTSREKDWAVIEIRDNGRGIADDKISKIFEIDFSRKDSQVRLRMGLSNAKGVIEKHGGSIRVDSEPGRGTCFEIRLPLHARVVPHFGGGWARKG